MKRWLIFLLSGLLLAVAAGCQTAHSSASSAAVGTVKCAFEAQYISASCLDPLPPTGWIFSESELQQYIQKLEQYEKAEFYLDNQVPVYQALTKYDASYFETHVLAIIPLSEPSGSIRHRVTSVSTENGVTTIAVGRYSPECQTCDMKYGYISVELRRDQAGSEFEAQMSETLGTMEEYEASN